MSIVKDIANREDLETLVRSFYGRLLQDNSINYLFIEVVRLDLEAHIPILVDFWEMVLMGTGTYRNNTMSIHQQLHQRSPLNPEHFQVWIAHLEQSIDTLFAGPRSELMKQKARQIAEVMQLRLRKP